MPLFLEDLTAEFNELVEADHIYSALEAIQFETGNTPISPRLAWKHVGLRLQPLLPIEHQKVLDPQRNRSWQELTFVYAELLGLSKGTDVLLMNMARAVMVLFRYTKRPARVEKSPPLAEVMYFLSMCDLAKRSVRPSLETGIDGSFPVFHFCKYCWRTATPKRSTCQDHSTVIVDGTVVIEGTINTEAKTHASRRGQASRQKKSFDDAILKILTREVYHFHQSEFTEDVLLPDEDRIAWLIRRRPNVWRLLSTTGHEITEDNCVDLLLEFLHASDRVTRSLKSIYEHVNTSIRDKPELIWPMVLRAEAWFLARDGKRSSWGGLREKAGRTKAGLKVT